ncbi:MAG: hypothetical protein IT556_07355 [Acetobacteraceae bacterium]|nr:hypothetical protein [Acetobacteraceae bacterium]
MAQLATVATIAATAANAAQGLMQMQSARRATSDPAAAQAAAALEAARDAREAEAANARARQRQSILEKTVASARARLAASGASPDSGSGQALLEGLRQDAAEEQATDDRQRALRRAEAEAGDGLEEATKAMNARLAAGRRSLLDASGALTGFTRAVRGTSSLGSGLRSLLDVF